MNALQQLLLDLKKLRDDNRADFQTYIADMTKMPADVSERIARRNTEIEALDTKIKQAEKLIADNEVNEKGLEQFKHPNGETRTDNGANQPTVSQKRLDEDARILREAKRYKALENIKPGERGEGAVRAYRFAKWFAGTIVHDMSRTPSDFCVNARKYCQEFGIEIKAANESSNVLGGYTVPTEFSSEIIDLREKYGVFRMWSRVVPMMSDKKQVPRRRGGLTVYNPAEGTAITASDKTWGMAELSAEKFAVLAVFSSELDEDSMINIGDDLAGEIAYAFANKEDECGFNGDGTSTYFSVVGVRQRLRDVYGTGGGVGLKLASGNAYSEVTLPDFNGVMGLLPQYADTNQAAWFCHKSFYHNVMEKLALAAGGVTAAEVREGARIPRFLGYPVAFSQVMPKTEANSQIPVAFGDLGMASKLGDRRQITMAVSDQYKFAEDQLAIRGTQRIAINVHDVGDTTDAGPIVGLILAAA